MTYRKRTVSEKLAIVKARKRPYDNSYVAAHTGYSETHVCNVLAGRHSNERIVNFAYNMARSRATSR